MHLRFSLYFVNLLLSSAIYVTFFELSVVLNDMLLTLLPSSGGFAKRIEPKIPLKCLLYLVTLDSIVFGWVSINT
jgi:hypothetical protein